MLERILTPQEEVVLSEERAVLRATQAHLAEFGAGAKDLATLEQSLRQLDELFLLVVVGEFNSGKSTLINALLGSRVLEEGVTPTTTRLHRLRHGETVERSQGEGGIVELRAPARLLLHAEIVDTPGTNALDRDHERITHDFLPRADLVLFVTSADRPFTESERAFIEAIRDWGKKLVVVLNKVDILEDEAQLEEIRRFITENARRLLGLDPQLFAVSSRRALAAPGGDGDPGFAALEAHLAGTLADREAVKLKLLNPLGVALRLAERYRDGVTERTELLREDLETLDRIDGELGVYERDMAADFRSRLAEVDNELHAFEKRGLAFFDDTVRLPRALDLMNKARVQADFESRAVADLPERLESRVEGIIDWMVAAELKQWQAASERLDRRRKESVDSPVGALRKFDDGRQRLLDSVGRTARQTIHSYDQRSEAQRMAASVQNALTGAALVEVGAIGLGAIFTALATTQAADLTGILAAGTLAVLGLFILPAKRERAKGQLSRKVQELRERLVETLHAQFRQEIGASSGRIREAIAPYSRFVRGERERLETMQQALTEAHDTLTRLRELIEGI